MDWGGGGLEEEGGRKREKSSLDFRSQQGTLLEKAMALHSSTLAWKIPGTEEPGRLQSMGSLGVGHN